jgi:hypothetical protein
MQHEKVITERFPGPGISTHVRVLLDALPVKILLPAVQNTFAGERNRMPPLRIPDGARNQ